MVSAPLPAIAEPKESDSKARLRLWIRLLRASRLIESVARASASLRLVVATMRCTACSSIGVSV